MGCRALGRKRFSCGDVLPSCRGHQLSVLYVCGEGKTEAPGAFMATACSYTVCVSFRDFPRHGQSILAAFRDGCRRRGRFSEARGLSHVHPASSREDRPAGPGRGSSVSTAGPARTGRASRKTASPGRSGVRARARGRAVGDCDWVQARLTGSGGP